MEKYRPRSATVGTANRKFLPNTQQGFNKTFFIQEKETGDKFFRGTRVGSCRKVVVKNGIPFALTYKVKNPRGEPMCHFNYTLKQIPKRPSSYYIDYCTKKQDYHLGMKNKPLVPYNPDHTRSRLPENLDFKVFKNISDFDIGNEGLVNRKQWTTTYKDSFKPIKISRVSNPGILSDMAKRTHYKLNNIEFS